MDDKTKKIFSKIRKCFALSQSANVNEAAVALKQAYALARQYNLDYRIAELSQITAGRKLPAGNQIKLPLFLAQLLSLINHIFQTRSVIHVERISDSHIQSSVDFYGYPSDVSIAEYAWEVLSNILIKSRTHYLANNADGRKNKSTKTRQADMYCQGWLHSVYEEVKLLGRDISEEERAAHNEQIKIYQGMVCANLLSSKAKENPQSIVSDKEYAAYQKGVNAGKTLSIAKGVGKASPSHEQLA